MAIFDRTPYVAYMETYDNTAYVAKHSGTAWENLNYNGYTNLNLIIRGVFK